MKTILITGASGFVGTYLARSFLADQNRVVGTGTSLRHPSIDTSDRFEWVCADTTKEGVWQEKVPQADVILNLAGRNIFRFWTKKYKQAMYDSRILTTRNIVNAMVKDKSQLLLTASAVGIYGDGGDTVLSETYSSGEGFLSQICSDWEAEGQRAREKSAHVAILRFGVVLGEQGALEKMLPAFKFCLGGPLGDGQQWFPWIHIQDIEQGIRFLINQPSPDGIFNFTAPAPVRQKAFATSLGRILNRPSFLPAPAIVIRTIMGELGNAFLESQRAMPDQLIRSGYHFRFEDLDSALGDLLGK